VLFVIASTVVTTVPGRIARRSAIEKCSVDHGLGGQPDLWFRFSLSRSKWSGTQDNDAARGRGVLSLRSTYVQKKSRSGYCGLRVVVKGGDGERFNHTEPDIGSSLLAAAEEALALHANRVPLSQASALIGIDDQRLVEEFHNGLHELQVSGTVCQVWYGALSLPIEKSSRRPSAFRATAI
jgi:hypothetical protein